VVHDLEQVALDDALGNAEAVGDLGAPVAAAP
jgi:hypothetical protein